MIATLIGLMSDLSFVINPNGDCEKYMGLYDGYTNIVYVNTNCGYDMFGILTHELGHHYWRTRMSPLDKIKYRRFISDNDMYIKNMNIKEIFAENFSSIYSDQLGYTPKTKHYVNNKLYNSFLSKLIFKK